MFTSVLLLMSILNAWAQTNDCSTPILAQQSDVRIVYSNPLSGNGEYVWYEFEAKTANVQIECSSYTYPLLYTDCNSLPISRLGNSIQSKDTLYSKYYFKNLIIGKKYLLKIYCDAQFKFAISEFIPVANDECVDASLLEQTINVKSTVQDISKSTISANSYYQDVWYRFVAKTNHVMISTNVYNTYLKLYNSCDSLSKQLDYTLSYISNDSLGSKYKFNDLKIGNEYIFKVESEYSYNPLKISVVGFQPEMNDECVGAKPIKVDTISKSYSRSLLYVTGNNNYPDLWYELELTAPVLIVDANVQLFEKCGGSQILPKLDGKFDSLDVTKKYLMKVIFGNNADSLQFNILNRNYLKNENCIGAETIMPSDTFVAHYADLSFALPSNVPYPGGDYYSLDNNAPDLWYKFTATSKSMTVRAFRDAPFFDMYGGHGLELALYDECNGNLIAVSSSNYGNNNSQTQIVSNNLEIGKQYYYRLIKSKLLILVRMGQSAAMLKDTVVHGVISNDVVVNDSLENAFSLCQNEYFSANTADYKTGREVGIVGSNCTTGIVDAKTKEMFFAFCTDNIGEVSIKSNNENLIVKAEILEKLIDNSFRQIGCSNLYYSSSENSYSFFFNKDYIPHNVFIRVEMSDTSKVLSDYDFGFVVKPIVYGAVDDKQLNSTFDVYPNPATDQITVKFENPSNSNLEIYDQVGKLVYSQVITDELTNINFNLQSGIYIAKVKNEVATKSIKLLIK